MPSQINVDNLPSNSANTAGLANRSFKQRNRALRRHESLLLCGPNPTTHRAIKQEKATKRQVPLAPEVPVETVARCKDLWFEDGDVIIWAQDQDGAMLYRVHRHVLKESGAEPFCTVVDCDYPNPNTSGETFLDGVWVLKYFEQDPEAVMYVLKWMYERPSISKRSVIPFAAIEAYLDRSKIHFIPAMRRCALEYLWNMLPTNLNYHQRVPCLVEDCYSDNPTLVYKPYVLFALALLSEEHKLIAILPLLHYYIAQWPMDWIIHGVPADCMGYGIPAPSHLRFPIPSSLATVVFAGREVLIRMREMHVFNFVEEFTSSGTVLDLPTQGCDGAKRRETGETCFEWVMRVWFFMTRIGFTARPSALEIMNMGQWAEFQRNCCETCGTRVMEHMLDGRDHVWANIPRAFGHQTWDLVVKQQKNVESDFEAEIR